jgi:endo-1,4-beta-xylanase
MQEASRRAGIPFGCAIDTHYFDDEECLALIAENCNCLVPENALKWAQMEAERGKPNWSKSDQIVAFALKHKMKLKLHCLFWHVEIPGWCKDLSSEELEMEMKKRIRSFNEKFAPLKDIILGVDVFNEVVDDTTGQLRTGNAFVEKLGPDYVVKVYEWAREGLWPGAVLVYNDYCMEYADVMHRGVLKVVKELTEKKLVDEVGFQMHQVGNTGLTPEKLRKVFKQYTDLGVKLNISEMDIRMNKGPEITKETMHQQAEYAYMIVSSILETKACTSIMTWGITDRYTWIGTYYGDTDQPLPFDSNLTPKPFLTAIINALNDHSPKQQITSPRVLGENGNAKVPTCMTMVSQAQCGSKSCVVS